MTLSLERRLMCNACVAAPLIGPYIVAGLPVWVVRNLRMTRLSHQGQAASLGLLASQSANRQMWPATCAMSTLSIASSWIFRSSCFSYRNSAFNF